MTPEHREQWRMAKEKLSELMDLPEPQRSAHLASMNLDAAVRSKLERLLDADRSPHPAVKPDPDWVIQAAEDIDQNGLLSGRTVGAWVLDEQIGAGGMATVYRCHRDTEDYDQIGALKLLRIGLLTPDGRSRFEREKRILAELRHPHIAGLLDAGTAEDGTPFIVMEYVDGQPVDRYVASHRPPVRELVALFLKVCRAVAFAQQNLVVHRDIKPSNIIVDGRGEPRLLDFGIARLLEQEDATGTTTRAFTPGYAAPEQLSGKPVTMATDVFGLGASLYRLVTGQPAFEQLGPSDPWPAPHFPSGLDPDLKNILGMAVQEDGQRRYRDAAAMAEDLESWIQGRPVRATGDSPGYKVRKYIARHRFGVAAGALLLLTGAAGLASTLWQSRVARQQSELAMEQTTRAEAAAQDARAEAARATAVTGFLQSIFDGVDPWRNQQRAVTADELVDQALGRVDTELSPYPALQADVLTSLGDILAKLGRYDEAKTALTRSVSLLRSHGDEESLLNALVELAAVNSRLDDLSTSEALLAEALSFGLTPVSENRVQARLSHAGLLCVRLGRCDEAAESLREIESRRIDIQALPGGDGLLADLTMQWASWEFASGNYADAAERALEAADAYRALHGPNHLSIAHALSYASSAYHSLGDSERSAPLEREALRIFRNAYGLEHPDTLAMVVAVGTTHSNAGRIAEAREHYLQAREGFRAIHGEDHSLVAAAWRNLAQADRLLGDYPAAAAGMERAVEILRSSDFQDYRVPLTEALLGRILSEWGRRADADAAFTAGLRGLEAAVGASHPLYLRIDVEYAAHLLRSGRAEDAEAARSRLASTYPALEAAYGSESVYTALAAGWLGIARLRVGAAGGPELLTIAQPILERVPSRYRVELAAIKVALP